jgi:hypothetical protein
MTNKMLIIDTELDRHSPLHEIIECLFVAIQNLSSNEYIYKDDDDGTNIHSEEVQVVINLLSHSGVSATDAEIEDLCRVGETDD